MRQKSSVENLVNYHFRVNNLHIQQKKRRKASQCCYGDIMSQMQRVYEVNKFEQQGAKKIIFTACPNGQAKAKNFLARRIDFTVLLLFELLKKHHLSVGQFKNRIH